MRREACLIPLLLLSLVAPAGAEVVLPAIISDGMVLQRDAPIHIWGRASEGERVQVSLAGDSAEATARGGEWSVMLPARKAGGPYELTVHAGSALVVRDVMVGDVWLCSGQSNMQHPLARTTTPAAKLPAEAFEQIRFFSVPGGFTRAARQGRDFEWIAADRRTADRFGGLCFLFGVQVRKDEKVPLGLIDAAVGSTPIEAWLPEAGGARPPVVARDQALTPQAPREKGKRNSQINQAELFRSMILPITPYALRGVAWYQGEGNRGNAQSYEKSLVSLMRTWREYWRRPEMSFLVVQLSSFGSPSPFRAASAWAAVRDAQRRAVEETPHAALVVSADLGNGEMHPPDKAAIAVRLAQAARVLEHGERKWLPPRVQSARGADGRVTLDFESPAQCLKGNAALTSAFYVLDSGGTWQAARATLNGSRVELTAPGVSAAKAVRYAWSDNPSLAITSCEGVPASPFEHGIN